MHRTHTCGELNLSNLGEEVVLSGWVQKSRDLGGTTFIDVRDRYGLTQLVVNTDDADDLRTKVKDLGREFVIKVKGTVLERSNNQFCMGLDSNELHIKLADIGATVLKMAIA